MHRAEAAGLPPLRVGLAAGEALNQGGDCERSGDERPARGRGAPVNLASRIAAAATPGDILADEKVAACGGFIPIGTRRLKGFEAPVRVFALQRSANPPANDQVVPCHPRRLRSKIQL